MNDVSAFDIPAAHDGQALAPMIKLAQEGVTLMEEIEGIEQLLKLKTGRLHELRMTIIPEAMAAVGLDEFKMPDGKSVKVETFVQGSIPKDEERRKEAFATLNSYGGEELIRTLVSLSFGKSEHNVALSLAADIRKAGFEPILDETVHPQTLMAFVREKLAAGEDIEPAKLGCFVGRKASFTVPKEPKAKKGKA